MASQPLPPPSGTETLGSLLECSVSSHRRLGPDESRDRSLASPPRLSNSKQMGFSPAGQSLPAPPPQPVRCACSSLQDAVWTPQQQQSLTQKFPVKVGGTEGVICVFKPGRSSSTTKNSSSGWKAWLSNSPAFSSAVSHDGISSAAG